MPLFEYRCLNCDSQFELLIRGGATPLCPSCGGTSLEKIISMFAVSSDSTQSRSRQLLGAKQKEQSKRNQAERKFYKHDHHDD
jgi:putative FmdB family regulatory protein